MSILFPYFFVLVILLPAYYVVVIKLWDPNFFPRKARIRELQKIANRVTKRFDIYYQKTIKVVVYDDLRDIKTEKGVYYIPYSNFNGLATDEIERSFLTYIEKAFKIYQNNFITQNAITAQEIKTC